METKPPKKEDRARTKQLDPLEANKTARTIAKSPAVGKSRRLVDPWLPAQLNYLSGECSRLSAGPIARRFLKEARARYSQYRECGCERLRFLCWSALNIVSDQLIGRAACSGEQSEEASAR
jgi:hypothetical protein